MELEQAILGQTPEPKNDSIHNSNGQLIKLIFENENNVFKQAYETYDYDEKGNLVRQTTFDKDGNLKAGYSDIAIYEYDFDTNNNEIEIRYIGEDKKPVQMEYTGPAIIKKKYDKKNRIIESRFLNGKGKLIKGFCRIEYDYDKKGNLSAEYHYDKKGKIITVK